MNLSILKPRKALNKAFLKVKPNRSQIELFKANLITLLDQINEGESEEFHKNLVSDFLKNTYYAPEYFINTKGRNDLVIHNGKNAKSNVGVILEAKKPTNKTEMLSVKESGDHEKGVNTKAFQELILYFLRERITNKNLEVRNLIITNIYEWYVIDASVFEKAFAQNKKLVKDFQDFEAGRLSGKTTDFFYKEIASPIIQHIDMELVMTRFDIREYEKPLRNDNKRDDAKLIALFKLLAPEHLLKLPFSNDSNSLNKDFYHELLHIIGLEQVGKSKKTIERKAPKNRNTGSLLENTITQLKSIFALDRLEKPSQYGETEEERLFSVGLELCITWVNRILFLKLLEAQLLSYHKGDKQYAFLNMDKIHDYDDLQGLFFQVLARKPENRDEEIHKLFKTVPYLNSSLFEPTELEGKTIFVSNLRDERKVPLYSRTVLSTEQGKRRTGEINALEYLFEFLNAYDFTSEGAEDIQEDNKTLINASVLGLIFEKINGYKDGSFFTPGFITMYMARETVRRSVMQKFNDQFGWEASNFEDLKEDLHQWIIHHKEGRSTARTQANNIIDGIKVCDPAVGSGHFLVSVLNEIITIKNELRILQDTEGKLLSEYRVEVVNDELIITNLLSDDETLYQYNPNDPESARVQKAIFHEKQTIIENCLFGVDINPNSVKICRLRLWIELLKNAYYNSSGHLETLPNIDINIKCGNSLISRFALDADLKDALKKSKWSIDSYKVAVDTYRNAANKEEKREMETLINSIKSDFRTEIAKNDPKIKRKAKLGGELFNLTQQAGLFEQTAKEKKERKNRIEKIEKELDKLSSEITEIQNNKIYENAFEWRFEFPEVLDDEGNFVGFDVVIGNPPYIRIQDLQRGSINIVDFLNQAFQSTGSGNYDIYIPFIELGYNIVGSKGDMSYIMPHKFINATYGKAVRKFLIQKEFLRRIIHFGAYQIFEDATTYTGVFFMSKIKSRIIEYCELINATGISDLLKADFRKSSIEFFTDDNWAFLDEREANLFEKMKNQVNTLETVTDRIFQGLKTSADKIFILEKITETESHFKVFCPHDQKEYELEKEFLFPLIKGGNSKAFFLTPSNLLILFPYSEGQLISLDKLFEKAPKTWEYLNIHRYYLENRENGKMKGDKWYGYVYPKALNIIKQPKIFTPDLAPSPRFSFDHQGEFMFTGGASGGYGIIPNGKVSPNILLAILNSKISQWVVSLISTQMKGGWFSFESRYIKNIPIPEDTDSEEINDLVVELNKLNQLDPIRDKIKDEIDQLVYQLYDLTAEEITIIEDSTK